MSSTKDPQLQRRENLRNLTQCILQHNMWKQATPLSPWQDGRDGQERLRHTSFDLHSPVMLEGPAQHPQGLPWEAEVRCPGPNHREADPLEGLRQVEDQGCGSLVFCSRFIFEPLHFHQNFPHCSLSSSISAISSVPINVIPLLPHRHLRCSQGFSPSYQSRHKRSRSLTRDILRSCKLVAAVFQFIPPSPRAPRFLLSCLVSSSLGLLGGRHRSNPTPVLSLYNLEAFSRSHSFRLGSTFSKNFTASPLVSFAKSWATLGWKPSHPTPVIAL